MITIMGATGNIGSKIADELLSKGTKIRVVGRDRGRLEPFGKRGAEIAAGDASNPDFLGTAFAGSQAVFALIPPDYRAKSMKTHSDGISEAIYGAIVHSRVTHVVNLSSVGAEQKSGTGPIKYLHQNEQRLNRIDGVNLLHLRPGYFMENLLANVPLIQKDGIMGSAIAGDTPLPMIATKDIAEYASARLMARDFTGRGTQHLFGPRDVTPKEAAMAVSDAIGRKVNYIQFDEPSTRQALQAMGFSQDMAELFLEMSRAFNSRAVRWNRTPETTTKTRIEEFAQVFKKLV
jgi:uncharacterized protein YbjT (DUF2867 family)